MLQRLLQGLPFEFVEMILLRRGQTQTCFYIKTLDHTTTNMAQFNGLAPGELAYAELGGVVSARVATLADKGLLQQPVGQPGRAAGLLQTVTGVRWLASLCAS